MNQAFRCSSVLYWIFAAGWRIALLLVLAWVVFAGDQVLEVEGFTIQPFPTRHKAGLPESNREVWEHGWPWVFAERTLYFPKRSVWYRWDGDKVVFRAGPLIGDSVIFLLAVGTVVWSIRRIARSSSTATDRGRFTLLQGIVAITLVSIPLGDITRRYLEAEKDNQAILKFCTTSRPMGFSSSVRFKSTCPRWFSRLRGEEWLTGPLQVITYLKLTPELKNSEQERHFIGTLTEFDHLRELRIEDTYSFNDRLLREMLRRRTWEIERFSIETTGVIGVGFEGTESLPRLKRLDAANSWIKTRSLEPITQLESVEILDLSGTSIKRDAIPLLTTMTNLQTLIIGGRDFKEDDCAPLIEKGMIAIPEELIYGRDPSTRSGSGWIKIPKDAPNPPIRILTYHPDSIDAL